MSASNYLEGKILDHTFGLATFTAPANLYVALYTAAPSDSGGGTEVTIGSNAYARVQVTNSSSTWTRSSNVVSNSITVTFPAPTPSGWGTITHFTFMDASSAGNQIGWGALAVSRSTSVGVALAFAVGDLTVTAD